MPAKLLWTDDRDTSLHRLRAGGASWDRIAEALGISRWSAIERGRVLGAEAPPKPIAALPDPGREALPAGHPTSWGLLTTGTSLEGIAYPWPPMGLGA
jgi:hypothetical protein